MKNAIMVIFTITGCFQSILAQQPHIMILDSGMHSSLRGLSIPDNHTVWVSGSNGSVARSTDGGKHFTWLRVEGFEQRDFRDIEAFDSSTAIIMAVAEPAVILKTTDAGRHWKKVFEDSTPGMFLDAMDFAGDRQHGIVLGDPVNQHVFLAITDDTGDHWQTLGSTETPVTVDSEAFFAASGSNIRLLWDPQDELADVLYVSGGSRSRLYLNNQPFDLPITYGTTSTGANSIIMLDSSEAVIVGGDFANDTARSKNAVVVLFDHEKKEVRFLSPSEPPHGYRSCIAAAGTTLVSCGTSGVDISADKGMHWQLISLKAFHVCGSTPDGKKVFFAGGNGKIGVMTLREIEN